MNALYFDLYALDLKYKRFLLRSRILGWECANFFARELMSLVKFKDITIEANVDKDDSQPRQG